MNLLEQAALAYENERHLYRIAYDRERGISQVMRGVKVLGEYANGAAAMHAMEDVRRRAGMREALHALAEASLPKEVIAAGQWMMVEDVVKASRIFAAMLTEIAEDGDADG